MPPTTYIMYIPMDHKNVILLNGYIKISGGHLPPTVELNALAMKRGEPTVYTFRHAPPAATAAPQQYVAHGYGSFPRMFNPRYPTYNRGFHPEPQGIYLVTLKVRRFVIYT